MVFHSAEGSSGTFLFFHVVSNIKMSAHEFHIIHTSFDTCTRHGTFSETKMNSMPPQTMSKTKSIANPTLPGIRKSCLHSTQILLLHSCVGMAIQLTVGSKGKKKVKVVCGSYSTAALRHIVLLPE